MSRWVRSKYSEHAEKWELSCDAVQASNNKQDHWRIPFEKYGLNFLPKTEYVECSPPEEWQNVTAECEWVNTGADHICTIFHEGRLLRGTDGYRLRKITGLYNIPYFIVERRKA